MREALAISAEEGLKEQWQRHEAMHHMLWDGLNAMGLKSFVDNDSERLITVNTIKVPLFESAHGAEHSPVLQLGYMQTQLGTQGWLCTHLCQVSNKQRMPTVMHLRPCDHSTFCLRCDSDPGHCASELYVCD